METLVKRSFSVPIRKLNHCASGVKGRELRARCRMKRVRRGEGGGSGGGGRGGMSTSRSGNVKDPSFVQSHQEDLEAERKLREARYATKNAERAAMRDHFRKKYRISKNKKDKSRLRAFGRKVKLPRELTKLVYPETKGRDNGFSLLSAFQGLSFDTGVVTGRKHRNTHTPTAANGSKHRNTPIPKTANGSKHRKTPNGKTCKVM